MKFLESFKIKANKRTLFILGGLLWGFAGYRVSSLGFMDLFNNAKNPLLFLVISAIVFYVFFNFIFSKMVKKHKKRILSSKLIKHCVFSFFDVKGYIIMSFMIVGGISLRNAHIINPIYLGTFYIGLGIALFSAGVMFLLSALNRNMVAIKEIS